MYIFHICILLILFYKLALPKIQQQLSRVNISADFQCASVAFASQGHKDFDHNENNSSYSKAILVSGK